MPTMRGQLSHFLELYLRRFSEALLLHPSSLGLGEFAFEVAGEVGAN
jgi:hypothetical protein